VSYSCSYKHYLSSSEKGLKTLSPQQDLNSDLCDSNPVLHQFRYRVNWELVIILVDDTPIDDEYVKFM